MSPSSPLSITLNAFYDIQIQSRFSRYPGFRFEVIPDGFSEEHARGVNDLYHSLCTSGKPILRELLVSDRVITDNQGPVTCIIADGLLGFVLEVAQDVGIPFIYFRTISLCAFWTNFCFSDLIKAGELPFYGDDLDVPIVNVKGMEEFLRRRDLPVACRGDLADTWFRITMRESLKTSRARGLILNTYEYLDRSILPHIRTQILPDVYTIGPLHEHLRTMLAAESVKEWSSSSSMWEEDKSCMNWLDEQPSRSVIYVSFGSLTTVTRDELMEFWHGLINSEQRFLLVTRPDSIIDKNRKGQIPDEILEMQKERVYVVGWAPQEEVLNYPAVGGFLTDSGWNSTLESIVAGVPMICWPFYADQHVNSRFVEKVWNLGLDMKDTCDRNTIEKMVGELKKLVEEGKIKYIGLSEASASTIRRAHAVHSITIVQNEWSLWSRDLEQEIVPTCRNQAN